jgi:SNF2 family DNA or RNA helicase
MTAYCPKTKPFDHQAELFARTRDLESFALFWEMGCGKTLPIIDTMASLFLDDKIDGCLVLAPKAVAPNWVNDELPDHLPDGVADRAEIFLWNTSKAGGKRYQADLRRFLETPSDRLCVLVMSYDAFMTQRRPGAARGLRKGYEAARTLLKGRRCLFVLDESARIKSPSTKRTKRVLAAGPDALYRRIMTGTPVANSPFDVYTQLKFLDPHVWRRIGCASFEAFKTQFGVWAEHVRGDNGQKFKTLVDYQNLSTLHTFVDKMGDRLLLEEVTDLPPKVYSKRHFDMSPEQKKLYKQIRDEFMVLLDSGDMITAPLAIQRILKLQQVTSGYCPIDQPADYGERAALIKIDPNPRIACLADTLEDVPHQALIWGKFRQDIDQISELLTARGDTFVRYDGRVSQENREVARRAFKAGDAQFFVGNPAAAGEGLTLTEAKTVIYYNTSYKLTDRLQSEGRAHRIGQDRSVHYIDIVATGTVDPVIIRALRTKNDLAAQVTGDKLREWI